MVTIIEPGWVNPISISAAHLTKPASASELGINMQSVKSHNSDRLTAYDSLCSFHESCIAVIIRIILRIRVGTSCIEEAYKAFAIYTVLDNLMESSWNPNISSRMNCLNFGTLIWPLCTIWAGSASLDGFAADLWLPRHWTLEAGWSKTCSLFELIRLDGNVIGTKSNPRTMMPKAGLYL